MELALLGEMILCTVACAVGDIVVLVDGRSCILGIMLTLELLLLVEAMMLCTVACAVGDVVVLVADGRSCILGIVFPLEDVRLTIFGDETC